MSTNDPRLLLIEDEANLRNSLGFILGREGFRVTSAASGEEGLALASTTRFDLVLLDLGLPGIDGFEVAQRLASKPTHRPVIVVLSGIDDEDAMIRAFDDFAIDYLLKPVRPRVLIARLRSLLARASSAEPCAQRRLGRLCIDVDTHEARCEGELLQLTRTEFDLLLVLATHPGRVHRRLDLIAALHGAAHAVSERSIDFQVHGLRHKLEPRSGVHIETVRGVGFKLVVGAEPS